MMNKKYLLFFVVLIIERLIVFFIQSEMIFVVVYVVVLNKIKFENFGNKFVLLSKMISVIVMWNFPTETVKIHEICEIRH